MEQAKKHAILFSINTQLPSNNGFLLLQCIIIFPSKIWVNEDLLSLDLPNLMHMFMLNYYMKFHHSILMRIKDGELTHARETANASSMPYVLACTIALQI